MKKKRFKHGDVVFVKTGDGSNSTIMTERRLLCVALLVDGKISFYRGQWYGNSKLNHKSFGKWEGNAISEHNEHAYKVGHVSNFRDKKFY